MATCPEPDEGNVRKILIRKNGLTTRLLEKDSFEGGKGQLFDPKSGAFPPSKLSFPFCEIIHVKKIHYPFRSCMAHYTVKPLHRQDSIPWVELTFGQRMTRPSAFVCGVLPAAALLWPRFPELTASE